ncbi:hypothetical protein U1Q18_037490 [Sarracenia purpurea var. burkii]
MDRSFDQMDRSFDHILDAHLEPTRHPLIDITLQCLSWSSANFHYDESSTPVSEHILADPPPLIPSLSTIHPADAEPRHMVPPYDNDLPLHEEQPKNYVPQLRPPSSTHVPPHSAPAINPSSRLDELENNIENIIRSQESIRA